ncbi:hypothetical protein HPB49_024820 [Dermacentor silvarum]|uniref:Uncharacterized protein n=1 Tax=Dermacentor silvarum TaxID=543639 RepID=A0ACB8CIG2_DERSI|nr:BTB/POZ domain-containing protein 6 [Dermacentor silvarum]KAH7942519.1 hypothetical protein HPB49_024820 [Dermacentor silvarum]
MSSLDISDFTDNGEHTDVKFTVKSKIFAVSNTFSVHKIVLAASCWFFNEKFQDNIGQQSEEHVEDLHPDGFEGLLKFSYTGNPQFESVEAAMYTRTAAKKYLMEELVLACERYIHEYVEADQVCGLIDYAVLTDDQDIHAMVNDTIARHGKYVLLSQGFVDCLEQTAHFVLDRITSTATEGDITRAVLKWADSHCRKTRVDFKTAVASFLPKLRFLSLTPREFVQFSAPAVARGAMTAADALAIMTELIRGHSEQLPPWLCRLSGPRKGIPAKPSAQLITYEA